MSRKRPLTLDSVEHRMEVDCPAIAVIARLGFLIVQGGALSELLSAHHKDGHKGVNRFLGCLVFELLVHNQAHGKDLRQCLYPVQCDPADIWKAFAV